MATKEFEFDPTAVTTSYCAALQNDRVCLALRIVDETGEPEYKTFSCKCYRTELEKKDTFVRRRRVQIAKRCEQCRTEHPTGVEADFDEIETKTKMNWR